MRLFSAFSHTIPSPFSTFSSCKSCCQVPLQPPTVLQAPAIYSLSRLHPAPELSCFLQPVQNHHSPTCCQASRSSMAAHLMSMKGCMLQHLPAGPALKSVALSLPLPTAVFRIVLFCRHIVLYIAAAATAAASYQQDNTPSLQRCSGALSLAEPSVHWWLQADMQTRYDCILACIANCICSCMFVSSSSPWARNHTMAMNLHLRWYHETIMPTTGKLSIATAVALLLHSHVLLA